MAHGVAEHAPSAGVFDNVSTPIARRGTMRPNRKHHSFKRCNAYVKIREYGGICRGTYPDVCRLICPRARSGRGSVVPVETGSGSCFTIPGVACCPGRGSAVSIETGSRSCFTIPGVACCYGRSSAVPVETSGGVRFAAKTIAGVPDAIARSHCPAETGLG